MMLNYTLVIGLSVPCGLTKSGLPIGPNPAGWSDPMARNDFFLTAVGEITRALGVYAEESGLKPTDYRLLFNLDFDWNWVGLIVAVKPGVGDSDKMWFAIKRHLNRTLAHEPEIAQRINLVVEEDSKDNGMMKLYEERFSPPAEILAGLSAI